MISNTVTRLAAAVPPENTCDDKDSETNILLTIFVFLLAGLSLILAIAYWVLWRKYQAKSYKSLSVDEPIMGTDVKNEPFITNHAMDA